MIIKNQETGESFQIDRRRVRVRRMQKRVHAWADTLEPCIRLDKRPVRQVMITLTYEGTDDWKPNQVREFELQLRKLLKKNLLAYAWVAEMQQRGAVHYHMILVVKKGTHIPMPDKSGLWPYGSSKIETAKSLFYIVKYTGKEYQKMAWFPKGLRMFAVWISGEVITKYARFLFKMTALPRWLADQIQRFVVDFPEEKIKRREGGGWTFRGEVFFSPYICLSF